MTTEYALAYFDKDGDIHTLDDGYETLEDAQHRRGYLWEHIRTHTKIMRRTVTPWEETHG